MTYQDFITSSLEEASKIANEMFGKVTGSIKGQDANQVLTEADLAVGKFFIERINTTYPDYNIIDEESGVIDNGSEFTWVIDPIDGTSNFAAGVPTYGIMLGLLQNDVPIAGGVSLPAFSEVIVAEKGKGAFTNSEKIQVTTETSLLNCLVAYQTDSHQEHPEQTRNESKTFAEIVLGIRNMRNSGSIFDLIMVAKGGYGGATNLTCKIWDNVAQQIILEEAGAVYTDFWGKPIDYTNPLSKTDQNYTFCTASPVLHKQLQGIIHKDSK